MVSKRCYLRDRPHKLPNPVACCCCCCCVGMTGGSGDRPLRGWSGGADVACASGCRADGMVKLLGGGSGSGEGCCLGTVGRGLSSGIGILLKCTERLDGGVYEFRGGSSSLMRCSPVGFDSYTTYWFRSSDSNPALTSAIRMRNAVWDSKEGQEGSHRVCVSGVSHVRPLAALWVRLQVTQSE